MIKLEKVDNGAAPLLQLGKQAIAGIDCSSRIRQWRNAVVANGKANDLLEWIVALEFDNGATPLLQMAQKHSSTKWVRSCGDQRKVARLASH